MEERIKNVEAILNNNKMTVFGVFHDRAIQYGRQREHLA